MTLEVDGAEVDTQSDLTRFDRLAGVEFTWDATAGQHFLVVTGKGLSSAVVAVDVGETVLGTPDPSTGPAPTESPSPSTSPTPTESASPTPTASANPSETPTSQPTTSPTVTAEPTDSASPTETPTEPPPSDPVLGAVSVSPSPIGPSQPQCTGDVVVRAEAAGATGGSAVVTGAYAVNKNIGGSVAGGVSARPSGKETSPGRTSAAASRSR